MGFETRLTTGSEKRSAISMTSLSLAVAFRPSHAEIVLDPAFGVGALFMPDDHGRAALEPSDAADDRLVLAEVAVACKRREILRQPVDIVAEVWDVLDASRLASSARG